MRRIRLHCLAVVSILTLLARPAGAATLKATADSTIQFHVEHKLHASDFVVKSIESSIGFDPAKPTDLSGLANKNVVTRWKDFDSGNKNRDEHLLETVHAVKFPRVAFVLEKVERAAQNGNTVKGNLQGRLYVNGVKQPVTAPVSLDFAKPGQLRVRAEFDVTMTSFNLEPPSLLLMKCDDKVHVSVDLIYRQ